VARLLLSGNEAIARGAWEAGLKVAGAYPGTPSTEIIEALARFPEVHTEWAPNEKVALEVTFGAAQAGARSLAAMKHVGLNVAADPLMTSGYIGVRAGLVIVTADDPGMFSSQNEQDNRNYARFSKLPMLEPSDSEEARRFTAAGLRLSETFSCPVLLRGTTRVCHARSLVDTAPRVDTGELPIQPGWEPDPARMVMVPANARRRHPLVESRLRSLAEVAGLVDVVDEAGLPRDLPQPAAATEEWDGPRFNRLEWRGADLGIVTGGIAYQYVREACPEASVLKLGMSYPLPRELLRWFAAACRRLLVVEELDPFWEEQIAALGCRVEGKRFLPVVGELSVDLVHRAVAGLKADSASPLEADGSDGPEVADGEDEVPLPPRPPVLCPGCPHRGVFYVLNRQRLTVTGDIGCYTLAVAPPLSAIDTCTCMGAGIGQAMGIELACGRQASRRTVAVIGDSTFIHSGITGLIEVVYNGGAVTTIILDNQTTAMTGHQDHPGTGRTAAGDEARRLDLERLCRAVGVDHLEVVDPYDLRAVREAVGRALEHDGPAVVIARRPCVLMDRRGWAPPPEVDTDACLGCGVCHRLGCPALEKVEVSAAAGTGGETEGAQGRVVARVNPALCTGCGLCRQVCPADAIGPGGDRGGDAR